MRDFTKAAAASLALLAGPAALTAVSLSSSDDPGATAAARADVAAAAPHRPAANVEKASSPAAAKDAPAPAPEASDASVTTHTHSGSLGVPGMSEPELREFETQVLGPEHALEHAQHEEGRARRRDACSGRGRRGRRSGAVARAAAEGPTDVGAWTHGTVPDPRDGYPCRAVAHGQGDVVLVSAKPESRAGGPAAHQHGSGLAVGSGDPADKARRPAALA